MAMTDTLLEAPPRKRDAAATRARILAAAIGRFTHLGYESTSLREIAALAGIDVALIGRYFGGKEGLFTEALKASIHPRRLSERDRASFVRDLAESMANGPRDGEADEHGFQFLLRAATSPTTAPLLSLAVQERFLGPIRDWLGGEDAEPRARVLAGVIIGFLVERLIRGQALRGRERAVFIERATAILTALVRD